MGLWNKLFGEFVDVIEWLDDSNDTLVYRFERYGNEIKYGAMLTVRESQVAILVNEGQLADVFEPGLYKLETANIPLLSTLQGWPHGFQSPFKAEVYFFSTRRFTDLKWGTKNPIMLRDQEFGPVRLRAYGTYAIRIRDTATFLREIVGTDSHFTTTEITHQLRNLIVSRFSATLGESHIPILDLAANYDDLSDFLTQGIASEFQVYGLELTKLLVENISLPKNVEEALDRRTSMGIVGNLDQYTKFQAAESMRSAAQQPGSGADAMGMGMGFVMAQKLSESLSSNSAPPQQAPHPQPPSTHAATPPPIPTENSYFIAVNGQQTGPYSVAELEGQALNGQLTRLSLVWRQGMNNWTTADQVEELNALFDRLPPPLPEI
jgi:membrane protease subunit (stomatin/prohibitin family)